MYNSSLKVAINGDVEVMKLRLNYIQIFKVNNMSVADLNKVIENIFLKLKKGRKKPDFNNTYNDIKKHF